MANLILPPSAPGRPKLDLYDPSLVLYLPLHSPDMVARGGGIENGTGTLDVSPQNLAVGANTLTATGAGTFIITPVQSTTCASGTATITGSPVTCPAGAATTVTTGVTTGTFTVTPPNIIVSQDDNRYLATITGATWGSQGRTFDGTDDKLTLNDDTAPTPMNFTTEDFTLEFWINIDVLSPTTYSNIINRGIHETDGYYVDARESNILRFSTDQLGVSQGANHANYFTTGVWIHGMITRSGANAVIYKNGAQFATQGSLLNPTSNARPTRIGVYGNGTGNYLDGTIGEVRAYNRALTAGEVMQNYLATKWRYQ